MEFPWWRPKLVPDPPDYPSPPVDLSSAFDGVGIGGLIARNKGCTDVQVEALRWLAQDLPDENLWRDLYTPPSMPASEECQALLREVAERYPR